MAWCVLLLPVLEVWIGEQTRCLLLEPKNSPSRGYVWLWLVNGRLSVEGLVVGRRYVSGEREFRAWVFPQIAGKLRR